LEVLIFVLNVLIFATPASWDLQAVMHKEQLVNEPLFYGSKLGNASLKGAQILCLMLQSNLMQKVAEVSKEPYQLPESNCSHKIRLSLCWNGRAGQIARLLLLAITVCVIWLTIEDRWGSQFALPTRYDYDAHYVLGMMKLVKEGDLGLFSHIYTDSLGAPFAGQLNDFPQTERVIIWLGGQIARVTGLMPAANIMLVLSCIIAAVSFYSAARLWRISRLLSWLFAINYAFLPHNFRSIQHIGVIFTGLLPLQFYILWYIAAAQRLSWSSRRFRLALIVSLLSGALNIYWIFLFLQLYAIAFLWRVVKRKRGLGKAIIPFFATCLVAGLFLGSFIIYTLTYGKNQAAVVRSYIDIDRWALKPIDLFLPLRSGTFPALSKYLARYYDGGMIKIGESFGSYVGFCAALGLLFLLIKGVQRQITGKSISLPCLAAAWIIAYSSFGGFHSAFSLFFNFYKIRGTNRYFYYILSL